MSYLYPYGDTQQLNLAWFLAKFRELYEYVMQLDPSGSGADIAEILARFTEQYDSTKTYIPGDYCIHDGYIYKANTTTTGDFDANAWDPALPVNDVQGLRILLGGLSTDLEALEQNAVTNVQYTPGAASADGLLRQTKNGAAETVMTVDKEPTENSQNPVKSGAVYEELDELKGSLNTKANISKSYLQRHYIIIGDSYVGLGLGTQIVDITGIDAKIFSAGGGGFVRTAGTYTFLTGLQHLVTEMTASEIQNITDIYILGGYNDYSATSAEIESAMASFDAYVKTTFPNATITVGMIAYSKRDSDLDLIQGVVTPAYSANAKTLGWGYIPYCNSPIHYPAAISSDGVHPLTTEEIAKYVSQYIVHGSVYYNAFMYSALEPYNNTIIAGNGEFNTYIVNGTVTVAFRVPAAFVFTNPFTFSGDLFPANKTQIGTYGGFLQGINKNGAPTALVYVKVYGVWINDTTFEDCDGALSFADGKIYLSIKRPTGQSQDPFTSSSFAIPPFSITLPSDLC